MAGSILLHFSELFSSGSQLKKTVCCGHKLDGLIFPKDFPWDLGQVTDTAVHKDYVPASKPIFYHGNTAHTIKLPPPVSYDLNKMELNYFSPSRSS
uniref:AGC-kinase C-terminal domain-containing protein n=1 Tax=Heterorhabditis bacteriophora TaxID=37862 RepID=A0A1I7WQ30_HETBA